MRWPTRLEPFGSRAERVVCRLKEYGHRGGPFDVFAIHIRNVFGLEKYT